MKETVLCNKFVKAVRKQVPETVVFRHSDKLIAGIPDISITWMGLTAWVEAKYITKRGIIDRGIQRLVMRRLSRTGAPVFYLIYMEEPKMTYIFAPVFLTKFLKTKDDSLFDLLDGDWFVDQGWSHEAAGEFVISMMAGVAH